MNAQKCSLIRQTTIFPKYATNKTTQELHQNWQNWRKKACIKKKLKFVTYYTWATQIWHNSWFVCCTLLHLWPSQARPGREHSGTWAYCDNITWAYCDNITWAYCDNITCRPEYSLNYALTSQRSQYLVLCDALQMKHRIRGPWNGNDP